MTVIQSKDDETLRQTYLRELGVQSYFPRRALPGAKASPACAADALKSDKTSFAAGVAANLLPSLETPVRTIPTAPVVAQPARTEPHRVDSAATEPVPAKDVKFAFAYFPVNEELAVINELPWARTAAVAPGIRQLLASILKALGVACDEKDLSSMVFSWPMPEMPLQEQGAESARLTLEGFLGRRFKLRPARHLLVLAEQSAAFLFPPNFSFANEAPLFRHPHFDVTVTVTRSLNAMEAVPEIKRVVWTQLQPLKAALESAGGPQSSPRPLQANSPQDNS